MLAPTSVLDADRNQVSPRQSFRMIGVVEVIWNGDRGECIGSVHLVWCFCSVIIGVGGVGCHCRRSWLWLLLVMLLLLLFSGGGGGGGGGSRWLGCVSNFGVDERKYFRVSDV